MLPVVDKKYIAKRNYGTLKAGNGYKVLSATKSQVTLDGGTIPMEVFNMIFYVNGCGRV